METSTFLESKISEISWNSKKSDCFFIIIFFKLHKNHKTVCFAKEKDIKLYFMGFGAVVRLRVLKNVPLSLESAMNVTLFL